MLFCLSGGQAHDAPVGRKLLTQMGERHNGLPLLMDRAYEGDVTRSHARSLGFESVVPPKRNRVNPWECDRELYKRRNEVERIFGRLKRFRRVFTRYDKLDVMFKGFIAFALIYDALQSLH